MAFANNKKVKLIASMVDDDMVEGIMDDLRAKDAASPDLGLRAYVWNIEQAL